MGGRAMAVITWMGERRANTLMTILWINTRQTLLPMFCTGVVVDVVAKLRKYEIP